MADRSFLDWPFFDDRHRALAESVDAWTATSLSAIDHCDTDAACRSLVSALGRDDWLKLTAIDPGEPASVLEDRRAQPVHPARDAGPP